MVHLAMIVGHDPRGYALVDSHTADRYHVPWDIGWDRNTTFVLVHVVGRAAPSGVAPAPLALAGGGCE